MQNAYGLIELLLVFGLVLGVLVWQLVVTRRGMRSDRERAAREQADRDKSGG